MLASGCETDDDFGRLIGLPRHAVNKIKNGVRAPTKEQALLIARHFGIDVEDLSVGHVQFRKIIDLKLPNKSHMAYFLRTISANLPRCKEIYQCYSGQFIVYTNRSKDDLVVASLLNIKRLTKSGIEFEMINPYQEGGRYDAYVYRGYMVPVGEFLYFVGEQTGQN